MLSWGRESASFFLRDNRLNLRSANRNSESEGDVPFTFMPSGFDVAAVVVADMARIFGELNPRMR